MSRDMKENSLSYQDQHGGEEKLIQEVLQYLVEHPDAKDTAEGILKWWLSDGHRWGRSEVQAALDLLTSKGWLTKRQTIPSKEIYGINKDQLQEITSFLQPSGVSF
jgi:Fe2+ or Zn2+ uptake regulation protein